MFSLYLFIGIMVNQVMLSHLFPQNKNIMNAATFFISNLGLIYRLYGFEHVMANLVQIMINSFITIVMIPLYIYVNQGIMNLNTMLSNDASKIQ